MWTFYILYSPSADSYYIGFTGDDPAQRLRRHNTNHKGFTGKKNDWAIVYTEPYTTKEEAYKREREVKKWKSRKLLLQLIGSKHSGS
jgi:putative endonuclease